MPNRLKDPQTRPSGQVEGEVDLTAVVRTTEKVIDIPELPDPLNHQSIYCILVAVAIT